MGMFADGPMDPAMKTTPVIRYWADEPMEHYSKKAPPGVPLHKGEHGGTYYVTESGEKVYVGGSGTGKEKNPWDFGPNAAAIDEGAWERAGFDLDRSVPRPAKSAPRMGIPAPPKPKPVYPVAKGVAPPPRGKTELGGLAARGGEEGAKTRLTSKLDDDGEVLRGSFPGDKERATAEAKRAALKQNLDRQVTEAEALLAQTEEYVKTAPITPTQKKRLVRTRKHVLQDAKEMKKLADRWEAHPEERITTDEAKQNLAEANRVMAEVQGRFTEAYQEIAAAKAKKARGKELKALKTEANQASEAKEHARRVLELSEAYAGKIVATHDPNMRTRLR